MTTSTEFEIDNHRVNVEIEFSLTPYHSATYFDPPEGGEVEDESITILEVFDEDGHEVTLTPEELEGLKEKIENLYSSKIIEICEKHAEDNFDSN